MQVEAVLQSKGARVELSAEGVETLVRSRLELGLQFRVGLRVNVRVRLG